ncbi:hypothetical protein PRIPAC_82122 [Pristionchus pacificus]|uniref:Protein kinase domain-containing protein n=1 Tax=Pristionchus pacificus TaxID=54126 RepID=A0A2A6CUG0_PRIPA|nr:hypothetical protein PRIPAC_82122 [Pristionchus pacificus]|eukprot:PDM81789.1 protein kinase [Pristionchus pacificus]
MLPTLMSVWSKTDSEGAKILPISTRFHDGWVVVESPESGFFYLRVSKSQNLSDLLSAAGEEGVVRFADGNSLPCTRRHIQFSYADHLHYGSFGDLVTRAIYTQTSTQIAVKARLRFTKHHKNLRSTKRKERWKINERCTILNFSIILRILLQILRKMKLAELMWHENIVRLHGFVIEEMTCYMIMEPLRASLSEVITVIHSNNISKCDNSELENFLGSMTVDAVSAIAFLLELKICSVLSPKRILIGDDGTVKICASAAIESGGAVPVRYSAPELLEGGVEKNYNKACVWSLAILLIEAATGHYPYSGSIDFVIADQITDGKQRPRLGKQFSHRMRNFVDACLFHSPQSRASVSAADANCLQNKRFLRLHAQREGRQESVRAVLQKTLPHLEELRKER